MSATAIWQRSSNICCYNVPVIGIKWTQTATLKDQIIKTDAPSSCETRILIHLNGIVVQVYREIENTQWS